MKCVQFDKNHDLIVILFVDKGETPDHRSLCCLLTKSTIAIVSNFDGELSTQEMICQNFLKQYYSMVVFIRRYNKNVPPSQ